MSKKLIKSVRIDPNEYNVFEGYKMNQVNMEHLATVLVNTGNLTEELYEKVKDDYIKYSYEAQVVTDALVDKYKPDVPWSTYFISYETQEISYYE